MVDASNVGDITLNGERYRIDVMSYKARDVIDFAPRATVPGGSVVMSDLGLYQPLVQTDWQHGFGFHWYEDALGYLTTNGNIDTRQDGLVMMFTASTASESGGSDKKGFITWNNAVYSYGASGIRKYASGSWSNIYNTAAVNFAIAAGDYLFFCPDNLRIKKINTSDTVTDAGLDADATDYRWLVIHNGFIYAGKDGTNRVHVSDEADLSDLEGTTADTNAISVGIGNKPTLGAVVYAGELYIAREDGLWHLAEDNVARMVLNYTNDASQNNFRSIAEINGFLVFPIRNRMIQWNGARVADFTPEKISDTFPYVTYGQFDNLINIGNQLFCTARTNETTYAEDVLCYDGVGWHKLFRRVTNGSDTITGVGYDTVNNYLWYHVDSTTDQTYYVKFQADSNFPFASFPATGTHELIYSRYDMGFRRVQKSMTTLFVEATNLTATRYIDVYYQLDGSGTWVYWDRVLSDGVTELKLPGGSRTREFYFIQLKFVFVTGTTTQSPILESTTLRFIMRPETTTGLSFNVLAGDQYNSDLREDERSGNDIVRKLRELRNSKAPIEMIDLLGDVIYGYVTAVNEQPNYRNSIDEDEEENIEYWAQVNFVQV